VHSGKTGNETAGSAGDAGKHLQGMARERNEKIRVLIVDDHPVFRDGLRRCLEAEKNIEVIAAAGSGSEMWAAIDSRGRPQVVLMDVEMPNESGIDLTRELREKAPDVRVVMLTAYSDSERVLAALKAGAVGYLLKNVAPDEIRATVARVVAGEAMLSGEIAGRVLREFEREGEEARYRADLDALTPREEEILKLLATGESNREIAQRLFISEQTVKNHVASIFRKLHVNDRTKAALLAVKLGLGGQKPP
jgi:DNA-binding NarL/FixJ family response regulator